MSALRAIILIVLLMHGISSLLWSSSYELTDLGLLPGTEYSAAYDINGGGQVVGISGGNSFLYAGTGPMQDLSSRIAPASVVYGINDLGQFVGSDANGHAFLCGNSGSPQDLGALAVGYGSDARAINNSGQVVGNANIPPNPANPNILLMRAFLYSGNGPMQDLGTLGGDWSLALDLNSRGQIVGQAATASTAHAFLLTPGLPMKDLGTLPGGTISAAMAINELGQIVGSSKANGDADHAFLSSGDGPMQDLGILPSGSWSYARGINNLGQIVGYADVANLDSHAFFYANGKMTDLNALIDPASGWTLWQANAINDAGQIVGYGSKAGGPMRAYLLTPVPEPSAFALLAVAVATLLAMVWQRQK